VEVAQAVEAQAAEVAQAQAVEAQAVEVAQAVAQAA